MIHAPLGFVDPFPRSRFRLGGYFEDETGWWMLDAFETNLPDSAGWFIGRDGQERLIERAQIPPLTYL